MNDHKELDSYDHTWDYCDFDHVTNIAAERLLRDIKPLVVMTYLLGYYVAVLMSWLILLHISLIVHLLQARFTATGLTH